MRDAGESARKAGTRVALALGGGSARGLRMCSCSRPSTSWA